MNPSKDRIKIFGEWELNMPKHDPYSEDYQPDNARDKDTTAFAKRANELITDAQLLVSNISYFNESKEEYRKKKENCLQLTRKQLNLLHEICNDFKVRQLDQQSLGQQFYKHLQQLYIETRQSKLVENQIQYYFKCSNLTNYNKQTMQIHFTKSTTEVQQELTGRIERINSCIHNLRESLFLEQNKNYLSSIFGKDYSFEYCIQRLSDEISHKNLIQIHYLMLFQLDEVDKMLADLIRNNNVNQSQYLKYEIIYDCLCLMTNQIEEMKQQEKDLTDSQQKLMNLQNYKNLLVNSESLVDNKKDKVDAFSLMSFDEAKTDEIQRNIKIYDNNLQNFKRVNAEINMYFYSLKKAKFIQSLTAFQSFYEQWKKREKHIQYLFERYNSFLDVKNQSEVNGITTEKDKKTVTTIYNQCLNYDTRARNQQSSKQLQRYQQQIILSIQKFMADRQMPFINKIYRLSDIYQKTKKERFFFIELAKRETWKQIQFIRDNVNQIKIYQEEIKYYLEQVQSLKQIETEEKINNIQGLQSLKAGLKYSHVISLPFDEGLDKNLYSQKLSQLQEAYEGERYYALPEGFDSLLFNYVNDLSILSQCFEKRKALSDQKQLSQKLQQLVKNKSKLQIDKQIQNSFDQIGQHWRIIYRDHLKNISTYSQFSILYQIGKLAEDVLATIKAIMPATPKLVDYKKMQINKSEFYSYGIQFELRELIQSSKCKVDLLKIININEILTDIFDHLDKSFLSKSNSQKVNQILKLTLLQKFFADVYNEKEGEYEESIQIIRHMAFIETVSKLQTTSLNKQSQSDRQSLKKDYLSSLYQIQLTMTNLAISQPNSYSNKVVKRQTIKLLKQIREYPLTIAAKHDITGFQSTFRYDAIIKYLRSISLTKLSLADISAIFISLSLLNQIKKITETKYDLYQNIVVKRRKIVNLTFEETSFELRPKIAAILIQIDQISKCFKDSENSVKLINNVRSLVDRAVI